MQHSLGHTPLSLSHTHTMGVDVARTYRNMCLVLDGIQEPSVHQPEMYLGELHSLSARTPTTHKHHTPIFCSPHAPLTRRHSPTTGMQYAVPP